MGKLVIGPEGFVDLRRNPEPTTVTVQGFTPEPPKPAKASAPVIEEPPVLPPEAPLPAIQKTAEGLMPSVAAPVKVTVTTKRPSLQRIYASDGHPCYVVVTRSQHARLAKHKWSGTRKGHLYRKVKIHGEEQVLWFHREAARCNKTGQFVGFRDLDERNCCPSNLIVFNSKEELHAHKLNTRKNA